MYFVTKTFSILRCKSQLAINKMNSVKFNDYSAFKDILNKSKNIIVLTGAGVSAESGIPIFRGSGGLWRKYKATSLATPEAFHANPGLVWEFYHYRRTVAFAASPNKAHLALARYEAECKKLGKQFTIITQNVDGLHHKAGAENVIELHGSLRKVRCTSCKKVEVNLDNPICEILKNRGDPSADEKNLPPIAKDELPKCKECGKLLRPHIVWFGENLEGHVLSQAQNLVESCDLCLIVGTSSIVYPAAAFGQIVAERGQPVAEFNLNEEPAQDMFNFHFSGPCGTTLPIALGYE
ncbi:hypothetical protein ABEB36_003547 [Hypothenemus hampei]|uniref:NAD-dependent protein deacylase n=1 Tax=Hypothenemus hampei TaxID=57062 RepID=A0ABD1FA81_HYPHA